MRTMATLVPGRSAECGGTRDEEVLTAVDVVCDRVLTAVDVVCDRVVLVGAGAVDAPRRGWRLRGRRIMEREKMRKLPARQDSQHGMSTIIPR